MSKELLLYEDFKWFLKRYDVFTSFETNLKNLTVYNSIQEYVSQYLKGNDKLGDLVVLAFSWSKSGEIGRWPTVSRRWRHFANNGFKKDHTPNYRTIW